MAEAELGVEGVAVVLEPSIRVAACPVPLPSRRSLSPKDTRLSEQIRASNHTFTCMYYAEPGLFLVCTWYVLVHTRKNKKFNAHDVGIRTVDFMHSNQRAVPLRYQRAFHGDILN